MGYVEGGTVKIEARWARGKPDTLPQLAQELVQLHAAILVATALPSVAAARAATATLPIVAWRPFFLRETASAVQTLKHS
jgi:putative tryptophan/tyrosine transport system substrate-binding protein